MNIPSECRTASIGPNHVMILPHNANPRPDGIFGKDTYSSLSKIASAITGTRWNGPKFFGLRDKLSK